MTERTPQNQDKFIIRLPNGMRDRIKRAADRHNRSMNAEIVATLEEKYPVPTRSLAEMVEYIRHLRDQAGEDVVKLAAADALEQATIDTLLDMLGMTREDFGLDPKREP